MSESAHQLPTIFETTPVAADEPLLRRPFSSLPLDLLVEAARIVTAYPEVPSVQAYLLPVVTMRLRPEELERLLQLRATLRAAELANAPERVHIS